MQPRDGEREESAEARQLYLEKGASACLRVENKKKDRKHLWASVKWGAKYYTGLPSLLVGTMVHICIIFMLAGFCMRTCLVDGRVCAL